MTPALFAAVALAFGDTGCKTPSSTDAAEAVILPADPSEEPSIDPKQSEPGQSGISTEWPPAEELALSIQTTPCLGTCPVYRLEVYRDGTMRYQGSQFTERIGTYRGKVAPEQLAKLQKQAESMNFAGLAGVYPSGDIRIMDLPSTILYFRTESWQNQVVNRGYANPDVEGEQVIVDQLRELRANIDALLLVTPLQLVGEGRQH